MVSRLRNCSHCAAKFEVRGVGAGVGDEAAHLPLELFRIAQAAGLGGGEERLVGDAAPQEEREPRREIEIGDGIGRAGGRPVGVGLDAVEELGADEQAPDGELDAVLEAAVPPALLVEVEQHAELAIGHGAAVGAAGQRRQDAAGARRLAGRIGGGGR